MIISDRVKFEFEYIDPCLCNAWVATAIVGSSLVGGAISAFSANKASDAQTKAAQQAAQMQYAMYNQTRSDLSGYRAIGGQASDMLSSKLPDLTTPVSVNPQDFLNSDMYKFLQTQGERAVTNSSAARGLGTSGAALKGAAAFESGLNAQQWQQNFNNQVTNQTNTYNRLKGLIDTGENAAAQTGAAGSAAAKGASDATIGAGNAQAAGYNAIGTAANNVANSVPSAVIAGGLYKGSPTGTVTDPFATGNWSPVKVGDYNMPMAV